MFKVNSTLYSSLSSGLYTFVADLNGSLNNGLINNMYGIVNNLVFDSTNSNPSGAYSYSNYTNSTINYIAIRTNTSSTVNDLNFIIGNLFIEYNSSGNSNIVTGTTNHVFTSSNVIDNYSYKVISYLCYNLYQTNPFALVNSNTLNTH